MNKYTLVPASSCSQTMVSESRRKIYCGKVEVHVEEGRGSFPEELTYELNHREGWPGRPTFLCAQHLSYWRTVPSPLHVALWGCQTRGYMALAWPISVHHPSSHND